MIKDVFVLKKKSWHVKLMRWIWNYEYYEFRNMCPYFWLSVLNVIIVGPFALFVGMKKAFIAISEFASIPFDMYNDYCDRKHQEWVAEMRLRVQKEMAEGGTSAFLERLARMHERDFKGAKKYRSFWYNLDYEVTLEIKNKITSKIMEERRKSDELEEKRELSKTQRIAKTTMLIKKFAKFILIAVGLGVAYLLYLLGVWLVSLPWGVILAATLKWTIIILIGAIIVVVAAALIYAIIKFIIFLFCKYGKYCIPCEERRASIGKAFRSTGTPFVWLGSGIVTLWQVLMALKKDNCPGIDWEE